jgi:hypothetical protein
MRKKDRSRFLVCSIALIALIGMHYSAPGAAISFDQVGRDRAYVAFKIGSSEHKRAENVKTKACEVWGGEYVWDFGKTTCKCR